MIMKLELDCTFSQLKNKVRNMKKCYIKTKDHLKQTGQGTTSLDQSLSCEIETMCTHFDLLEEIYSDNANVTVPYIHDSTESTDSTSTINNEIIISQPRYTATSSTLDNSESMFPTITEPITSGLNNISTNAPVLTPPTTPEVTSATTSEVTSATATEVTLATTPEVTPATTPGRDTIDLTSSPKETTKVKFQRFLSTRPPVKKQKYSSNALTILNESNTQRVNVQIDKIKLEEKKFDLDKEFKSKEVEIRQKELQLKEKQMENEQNNKEQEYNLKKLELDLKTKEIEKQERLETLKIEKQFELDRYKIDKENSKN